MRMFFDKVSMYLEYEELYRQDSEQLSLYSNDIPNNDRHMKNMKSNLKYFVLRSFYMIGKPI